MKEELINKLFAKFDEQRESFKEQLLNGINVIVLHTQNDEEESIRLILHYDDRKKRKERY